MNARIAVGGRELSIDVSRPVMLAVALDFAGPQPRHFSAPRASSQPFETAGFKGSVERGASCNCERITLIPPGLPHSPQRPANTVGLVIERTRRAGELDGFQWYCEHCGHRLYEEFFPLTDIEKQFPPVFERFFASAAKRTCGRCGKVMERS